MLTIPNDALYHVLDYLDIPSLRSVVRVNKQLRAKVNSYLPVKIDLLRHYLIVLSHLPKNLAQIPTDTIPNTVIWFKGVNVRCLSLPIQYLYFNNNKSTPIMSFKERLPSIKLEILPNGTFHIIQTDIQAFVYKYGKAPPAGKPIPTEFKAFIAWIQRRSYKDL
jgi:hypothetical protein